MKQQATKATPADTTRSSSNIKKTPRPSYECKPLRAQTCTDGQWQHKPHSCQSYTVVQLQQIILVPMFICIPSTSTHSYSRNYVTTKCGHRFGSHWVHKNTGLFISPSGISELDCATTKTDTAERSISIGRESIQVFFVLGALAYFQVPRLWGSRDEKWRSQ